MPIKILVADDHIDSADSTAELFRMDGRFEVKVVYDGLQAVEAARTFVPDLVLLDINMPKMDGYQAASLIRSEHPSDRRLILVAFTGRTSQVDIDRALRCGFDHNLSKSMVPGTLCASIASFMEEVLPAS